MPVHYVEQLLDGFEQFLERESEAVETGDTKAVAGAVSAGVVH